MDPRISTAIRQASRALRAQPILPIDRNFSRNLRQSASPAFKPSRPSRNLQCRYLHNTRSLLTPAPKSKDRGPKSEEDTQTDFGELDVLRNTATPATAIDATIEDGFIFNNEMRTEGCGVLLVGGELFKWRPWIREGRKEGTIGAGGVGNDALTGKLKNVKGQLEVQKEAWGLLDLVWPKPDLLIIGTGPSIMPISPATRKHISDLGIRVEVADTRNASAQFNLLATERGVEQVAAALIPIGWKEGR